MNYQSPLLFGVGFSILFSILIMMFQPTSINFYDESVMLMGALQVQNGVYPGSGFFAVYGPLQFFIPAGLLSIFDGNIIALRIYHVATVSLTLLALASLFKPTSSRDRVAITALFLVLSFIFVTKFALPLYPTHMISMFGALFVVVQARGFDTKVITTIFALTLFLTGFAFLAPISCIIVLIMLFFAIPFNLFNNGRLSPRAVLNEGLKLIIATALTLALASLYDRFTDGSLTATVKFLFEEQIPVYASHRNLPFPTFSTNSGTLVSAYFPIITFVLGAGYYFYTAARRDQYPRAFRSTFFWLLFFCLAFYPSGLVRTHGAQLWPTMLFALAAALFLLANMRDRKEKSVKNRSFWISVSIISAVLFIAFSEYSLRRKENFATDCQIGRITTSPSSCLHVGSSKDWPKRQRQISFLDSFLHPKEPLFITTDRHDQIFAADLSYYFLLNRLPLTRWAHLEPGIQTTMKVQQQIIDDLRRNIDANGRSIVLVQPALISNEPNMSSVSSNVFDLDEYLETCEVIAEFETLKVIVCK